MQIIESLFGLRVAAVLGVPWSFESYPVIRRYLVSIGVEEVPILVIWIAFLVVIELSSR
jgi:type IV secretory pathway VirB3-like protein